MPSAQAIRAGAAYVELYTKDSRLVRGLARASKRLQAFGASVRAMGLKVAIDHKPGGQAGVVTIRYDSLDELDDICRKLGA